MSERKAFNYTMSVTAPQEYPVEVYLGYFADKDKFISAIPKAGMENQGWIYSGADAGMEASHIPSFVELTWISYSEKKFWKVQATLPKDTILTYFQKGFKIFSGQKLEDATYDQIVVGVAPGGVVVIWLEGSAFRVEIGRYQAKDTIVNVNDFYRNPDQENQQQFYDSYFKLAVTKESQEKINKEGIQYGLWDEYRKKYNWRFRTLFYDGKDKDAYRIITYFNGERAAFYEAELNTNPFLLQAIPYSTTMGFKDKNTEAKFDEKEIFEAFKQLTKNNKQAQIEIIAKVGFMYNGMSFWAESGGEKILLPKTKILGMWNNR